MKHEKTARRMAMKTPMMRLATVVVLMVLVVGGPVPAQDVQEMSRLLKAQEAIDRAVVALQKGVTGAGARDRIEELAKEAHDLVYLLERSRSAIIYFQVRDMKELRMIVKKAHFALAVARDLNEAAKFLAPARTLSGKLLNETMNWRAS
jgi:type II secretory pathway component PulJ